MIVVFLKTIILFLVLFLVLRIMGKRQLGEMQPFELVITLIIAEVAAVPMNDPFIPIYYGVVPIVTLGALHLVFSFFARKSTKVRHLLSGRSVTVIDKQGINYENLKKMNMSTLDLLEAVRAAGYSDFNTIAYAIFETNGKICVIEKERAAFELEEEKLALLPIQLFSDGAWDKKNLLVAGLAEEAILEIFQKNGYKNKKEILYADIRQNGVLFVSPKAGSCFTEKLQIAKEW